MTGFSSKRQAAKAKLDNDTQVYADRKRGSIALARSLCYQIAGAASEDDDISGSDYGSVDVAEILSAEVVRLQAALAQPEQEPVEQYAKLAQHCAMLEHKLALIEQEHALHKLARLGQEIEQEPVAWAVQACSKMWRGEFAEIDAKAEAKRIGGTCVAYPLYTTPPAAQRQWVGLTEGDWAKLDQLFNSKVSNDFVFSDIICTVESKLKEKNT